MQYLAIGVSHYTVGTSWADMWTKAETLIVYNIRCYRQIIYSLAQNTNVKQSDDYNKTVWRRPMFLWKYMFMYRKTILARKKWKNTKNCSHQKRSEGCGSVVINETTKAYSMWILKTAFEDGKFKKQWLPRLAQICKSIYVYIMKRVGKGLHISVSNHCKQCWIDAWL